MPRSHPKEDREALLEFEHEDDQPGRDVIIMLAVFLEGGLAAFSIALGWCLSRNPLAKFSWNPSDALLGALAVLPLIGLFLAVIRWPIGPLRHIRRFCEEEFVPLLAGSTVSDMALIALSAGVAEEMLFRGLLQTSLGDWLGAGWGLVLSSFCFGLLHPISIPYSVFTMCVGLYLGTAFLLSGNLLTVMVMHVLYDLALMSYLLRVAFRGGPTASIPTVDPDADIDD